MWLGIQWSALGREPADHYYRGMLNRPWLHDVVLLLLRLTLALVVGAQSYQIFLGHGVKESSRVLEKWGMANAFPFTVVLGIAFVLCAIGILLGFLTPLFAVIGAVAEAAYGYFLMTGGNYDLTTSSAQMTCLVVASLLALMVLGAGRVSTDAVLTTRSESAVAQY